MPVKIIAAYLVRAKGGNAFKKIVSGYTLRGNNYRTQSGYLEICGFTESEASSCC